MTSENPINCPICLGSVEDPVNFCPDNHETFCQKCIASYIDSAVCSAYLGTCPVISCPSTQHEKKKRRILQYPLWRPIVTIEIVNKHTSLAGSLLAFLCGGCHALKSLDLGFESDKAASCYSKINTLLTSAENVSRYNEFERYIESYCSGDQSVEEIYETLSKVCFPQLSTADDVYAWDVFSNVLKTVPDPERRANLHLRYLRDHPRIRTLCCNRDHCFKCKTKDYHEGKTCAENVKNLDHSIVNCPSCNIAIAKGDGCNTVTCVCGKQFSWSAEKENTERCHVFLQQHPDNTTVQCANLLCSKCTQSAELVLAKAWQTRHRIEVNRALKLWFKQQYYPCPTQASLVLPQEVLADGVREAIELWKQDNNAAVEKARVQNDIALRSIFLNLYPETSDRPVAANSIITLSRRGKGPNNIDPKLVQSAQKWVESNRAQYIKGIEEYEVRSAKQFLFLYGTCQAKQLKPCIVCYPGSFEWNRDTSNPDLTFTNESATVERIGSVSCYPAAFSKLTAERSTFKVLVDAAPKSSNWLTFGVARVGMPNSSSDGIGRTSNTWGLSDDRSSSSSHCIVASSGTEVSSFRKLQVGDVLCAMIDVNEGWCEISVNDSEFSHRFSIQPGTVDEYSFAMTFANDHRVTILCEPSGNEKEPPKRTGELNSDHTTMYNNLKKQIKHILADTTDDDPQALLPTSKLMTDGAQWVTFCGGDKEAKLYYDELKPLLDQLLSMKRQNKDANTAPSSSSYISDKVRNVDWNQLLEAVSWYRQNRDHFKHEQRYHLALQFATNFADDAPFIAAYRCAHRAEKGEMEEACAYMQCFSDEMNTWYDFDLTSSDPVIENIAKNCRCLPRHLRTCPKK